MFNKRLMKKIENINWVISNLNKLADEEDEWERFYRFNCDSFFMGETKTDLNNEKYEKNMKPIKRNIAFLLKQKERLESIKKVKE